MLAAARSSLFRGSIARPSLLPSLAMAPKRKAATSPVGEDVEVPAAAPAQQEPQVKKRAAPKRAPKPPPPPPGPVYDPATMRRPRLNKIKDNTFTVLSWNVAGLRGLLKKDPEALQRLVAAESPDVVCLQEHKLQDNHCSDVAATLVALLPGWHLSWNCSQNKKGYSGTALLCRDPPLSVESGIGLSDHDGEGRVITAEMKDVVVCNVYVPNSGEGLKRLEYRVGEWDAKFSEYVQGLEARGKPVILTGDMNCAAEEIDIHSPKTNLRSAGFTKEERDSFAERYLRGGLVDCFRAQHPGVVGYTYWGYRFNLRAKNKGWRLDYFLVSEALAPKLYDCFHMPEFMGSDHCPLGLVVKL